MLHQVRRPFFVSSMNNQPQSSPGHIFTRRLSRPSMRMERAETAKSARSDWFAPARSGEQSAAISISFNALRAKGSPEVVSSCLSFIRYAKSSEILSPEVDAPMSSASIHALRSVSVTMLSLRICPSHDQSAVLTKSSASRPPTSLIGCPFEYAMS